VGFVTLRPDFIGTCPLGHITADKKLHYASSKLPSATSFIRKTLSAHCGHKKLKKNGKI